MDHAGHRLTLILVGLATLAELARLIIPKANEAGEMFAHWLHMVHWIALAVALAYLFFRVVMARNVAKELAQILDDKPQQFITLFPSRTIYAYERLQITPADVTFVGSVSDSEFEELSILNEEGFEGSAFEIEGEKLRQRNAAWVAKNKRLFMLAHESKGTTGVKYLGYTCITPLSAVGEDVYFRGLIKDQDLPVSLICGPNEPSNAYLIFAVVLRTDLRKPGSLGHSHLNRLLKALQYHIDVIVKAHAGQQAKVYVWSQSEHKSIVRHLERQGFRATDPPTRSAEGFDMLRLEIPVGR